MITMNIALPSMLREEADQLIAAGKYASISDLVRTALRQTIARDKYDLWADQARREFKAGKVKAMKSADDIDDYFEIFKQ